MRYGGLERKTACPNTDCQNYSHKLKGCDHRRIEGNECIFYKQKVRVKGDKR